MGSFQALHCNSMPLAILALTLLFSPVMGRESSEFTTKDPADADALSTVLEMTEANAPEGIAPSDVTTAEVINANEDSAPEAIDSSHVATTDVTNTNEVVAPEATDPSDVATTEVTNINKANAPEAIAPSDVAATEVTNVNDFNEPEAIAPPDVGKTEVTSANEVNAPEAIAQTSAEKLDEVTEPVPSPTLTHATTTTVKPSTMSQPVAQAPTKQATKPTTKAPPAPSKTDKPKIKKCPKGRVAGSISICMFENHKTCTTGTSADHCVNLKGGPFNSGKTLGVYECTVYDKRDCPTGLFNFFKVDEQGLKRFPKAALSFKCPCARQ